LPPLPYTPGKDGAGIVEKVGEAVTSIKEGQRVWLSGAQTGTYAQFAICDEVTVHPLPDSISFQQGAALWTAFGTAYYALYHIGVPNLNGPNTILIHGASGGVGLACVQFAKQIPNTIIIGTAGTQEGCEFVLKSGANHALNHREPDYLEKVAQLSNNKVDIILEMLANVNLANDLKLLNHRGRVVIIGSRGTVEINPRDLMSRRAEIRAVMLGHATPEELKEIKNGIQRGLEYGTLNPVISKTYSLDSSFQAHKDIMASDNSLGSKGKLVINTWE